MRRRGRKYGRPLRQTWFVIDELRVAGRLDEFNNLLVEGRQKGACAVLGYQNLPGLMAVYGEHLAHELVGQPGNKAFLRITEPKTMDFASSCFKTQDIELPRVTTTQSSSKEGTSVSESFSSQRLTQPVVLPGQFESDLPRPNKQVGLCGFYQTAAVGHPYFAKIDGELVEAMLPELDHTKTAAWDRDFIPRFPPGSAALAEMSLKEWTEDDLKRLNLEQHPELLETDADRAEAPAKKNWGGIVPDR